MSVAKTTHVSGCTLACKFAPKAYTAATGEQFMAADQEKLDQFQTSS